MQNTNSQPPADEEILEIAGNCANPKCRKVIITGQSAVWYGKSVCCNYACLSHYMFGVRHGI